MVGLVVLRSQRLEHELIRDQRPGWLEASRHERLRAHVSSVTRWPYGVVRRWDRLELGGWGLPRAGALDDVLAPVRSSGELQTPRLMPACPAQPSRPRRGRSGRPEGGRPGSSAMTAATFSRREQSIPIDVLNAAGRPAGLSCRRNRGPVHTHGPDKRRSRALMRRTEVTRGHAAGHPGRQFSRPSRGTRRRRGLPCCRPGRRSR